MSKLFQHYLAGLIATAREFSLLWAPTINSYKRFQLGSWAPTGIGWGIDNRTLGFRKVGHGKGTRVECRIPGSDANSYFAFAGTIAGGLYGIRHELPLGEPFTATATRRGDRPHPVEPARRDRLWEQSADRQGVLRRRRAPPHPHDGQGRVGGVQPDRHRLGAPPLLGAHLVARG
jgi:glutamine synthetase